MMNASNQYITQFQRFTASIWYIVRNPKTTAVLLAVLLALFLLGLALPEQIELSSVVATRTLWITSLPLWIRSWGELLFFMGFSKLFQSFWFGLPLALLLLNSLLALADYAPGIWRRMGENAPPINWQHPLANRVEHSVRLSSSPNNLLTLLRSRLVDRGFFIYQQKPDEQKTVSAVHRRWAWMGMVAFYGGLILLAVACSISRYSFQTANFTLFPATPKRATSLIAGNFELTEIKAEQKTGRLVYSGGSSKTLTWRLYRPLFLDGTLTIPTTINPILTVESRDGTGNLLEVKPLQRNTPSAGKPLNLLLDGEDTPLYFTIPAVDLAFKITPAGAGYVVQAQDGTGAVFLDKQVEAGQPFAINGLSVIISRSHNVEFVAVRDIILPLYPIAILLLLMGVIAFLQPPSQFWFIPDIKGRGGQLYGVMEGFGSEEKMAVFLRQLLDNLQREKG